jgi:hypothetical protein
MRAIEALDVAPENWDLALQELDEFLRDWADKYHQDGGKPMALYAAVGPRSDA